MYILLTYVHFRDDQIAMSLYEALCKDITKICKQRQEKKGKGEGKEERMCMSSHAQSSKIHVCYAIQNINHNLWAGISNKLTHCSTSLPNE